MRHVCLLIAAALPWGAAAPLRAQSSSASGASGRTPLTLSASLFSAQESTTESTGLPPEQGRLNLALGYAHNTRRHAVSLSAGSVLPYSGGLQRDRISYAGGVQFSSQLGRRTRFDASQSISLQPLNIGAITGSAESFPGGAVTSLASSTGLFSAQETKHDGAFSLSRALSARSSAAVSFTHSESTSPGQLPASSRLVAVSLQRRLSAAAAFHAGYGFGTATFASESADPGMRHDIDVGFSLSRPVPFSTRTVFDGSTGTALVTDGTRHRLRLVASGGLFRAFGRWSSRVGYSRPMQYVAGFKQPFFSDAVNLSLDGRPWTGWGVSLASGAARGSVGFGDGSRGYASYSVSMRLQRAIARDWHFEAEGFATSFHFISGTVAGAPLPPRLERRGVRVGVSWSTAWLRR